MTDRHAFLCDAVRTPIAKLGGSLATIRADDLGAAPIRALMERSPNTDWGAVEEVFFGAANQAGEDNRNAARMAALLAGLPPTIPGVTLNRLCASGLEAVGAAARAIKAGEIDLTIAGGAESMTRAPYVMAKPAAAFARDAKLEDTALGWRLANPEMQSRYGIETMPQTGENVASTFGVSRQDQDAFALRSQQRAALARTVGFFAEEISPVVLQNGRGDITGRFEQDEHLRPQTQAGQLAKLAPLFAGGTVTAGNASGLNDGAAAMVIASEEAAVRQGLTPRARILGMASAGVAPTIMGVGPIPAVEKLIARLGLAISQFDAIELNEAFASQAIAVLRGLGLPEDADHVNPNGGAIALGHPLGMSGARLAMTVVHQLEKTGGRYGLATLCVGVGQGLAVAFERV